LTFEWFIAAFGVVLTEAGEIFLQLLPYMLSGVIIGEILKFTSWTKLIYKWITYSKHISVIAATALGILSPLCTQGTIPVVITLYQGGVPVAPLISFLAASSLMNPQLFIMTWGGLGMEFALMRLLIVILFSVLCGCITMYIPERLIIQKAIYNFGTKEHIINRPLKKFTYKIFFKNCFGSLLFVGKYIIIGVFIGTLIEAFVPQDFIMSTLGTSTIFTILVAAIAGIPLYACGGGIIPTVRAMIIQGMDEGAAMAFMTVGQATRLSPLIALAALLKPTYIIGYCLFLILFSTLTGLFI
jgi:uncharacterized protein